MINLTLCDEFLFLFMSKSEQIFIFNQNRVSNGYPGVIENADSEYVIVNDM